jgi:hypothetical protein
LRVVQVLIRIWSRGGLILRRRGRAGFTSCAATGATKISETSAETSSLRILLSFALREYSEDQREDERAQAGLQRTAD